MATKGPQKDVRALERAYRAALRRETDAISALPEHASKASTDRCWRLAEKTNAALRALQSARGDAAQELA